MKIYVVMAQRKCRYPGQYAPEALAVQDEYGRDENAEYLADVVAENESGGEFDAVACLCLEVDYDAIERALFPAAETIKARVVEGEA
jgi:hypothetical protein